MSTPNFCAAANMSIPRNLFQGLGGFDCAITSSEDQDLAMRHTAKGGLIAFLPEAEAVHHDNALDIRSYCRRAEWGIENMLPFCHRYPELPDNIERAMVNGLPRWGEEPSGNACARRVRPR
jgi:GT2 family glycosyltransferase